MRWLHFRTRLVGVHNPARCLAMTRICRPRLRRGCGSESRSGPGGDVEAARVDYVVTGVEARRVRVAVLSRTTTRGHPLARRCSIGPRFLLRKNPRGKRCDARGASRNRPTVAPPMPRTEGKLPRNAVRDKRWRRSACGCKNHPQPALLFFSGQKCDGCIFGRDSCIS